MNLADHLIQTLALADGEWVQFDTIALSVHPGGYTAEEANLILACLRDLADKGPVELNEVAGIIFLVRLAPERWPSAESNSHGSIPILVNARHQGGVMNRSWWQENRGPIFTIAIIFIIGPYLYHLVISGEGYLYAARFPIALGAPIVILTVAYQLACRINFPDWFIVKLLIMIGIGVVLIFAIFSAFYLTNQWEQAVCPAPWTEYILDMACRRNRL